MMMRHNGVDPSTGIARSGGGQWRVRHKQFQQANNKRSNNVSKSIRPAEVYQIDSTRALFDQQQQPRTRMALDEMLERLAPPSPAPLSHSSKPTVSLFHGNASESQNYSAHHYSNQQYGHQTADCLTEYGATYHSTQSGSVNPATSLVVCNNTQLTLMNIKPEEFNFSDIEQVWLIKSWQEILFRVAFVIPIVLLGILGNATIIYSMCRFKPIRSKPTNIFILNMALADLLTTIVCPNAALLTDIYQFYVLGSFVCRTEGFIKITCLLVSAYSLIVLSFDWFLSVVKPFRSRIGIRQAWLTLVSIWLVSIMMAVPLLFSRRLRERHWRDLTEVWCCELIQYTKYYWVCITFFLIYLPTFVMTIVLVVILAQMDRFEAKLRRSRGPAGSGERTNGARRSSFSSIAAGIMRSSSFSIALDSLHQVGSSSMVANQTSNSSKVAAASAATITTTNNGQTSFATQSGQNSLGVPTAHNNSLTMSMKYRRRIVKILFFYLLTSIVCWTPLQFTIIYRFFRSEAVPADWFFELTFFSQLCASLSAAMNPIIFGFLSQPFRKIVVRSCLCRLFDKLWKGQPQAPLAKGPDRQGPRRGPNGASNCGGGGGGARAELKLGEELAMSQRLGAVLGRSRVNLNSIRVNNSLSGHRAASTRGADLELQPKLNIDYVEYHPQHHHHHHHHHHTTPRRSTGNQAKRHDSRQQRPKSATIVVHNNAQTASTQRRHHEPTVRRSLSSRADGSARREGVGGEVARNQHHRRALGPTEREVVVGRHPIQCGVENEAFTRTGDDEDERTEGLKRTQENGANSLELSTHQNPAAGQHD